MLAPALAILLMSAAPGFLVGSVYVHKNKLENSDYIPILSALFLPLSAVLAVVVLTQTNGE